MSTKDEALLFVCDEAACHHAPLFYETFTMDYRWSIIRAILDAAKAREAKSLTSTQWTEK